MIDVRTENVLQAALDRAALQAAAPGVVAAVRCEGLGAWSGASGSLDLAGNTPLDADVRLPIYSITKSLTAVCVVRLAEIGALRLDDPIGGWVPALSFGDDVSLRQLLNHTAGVPNYSLVPEQVKALAASPRAAWGFDDFRRHTCEGPLDFAPGSGWSYSNTGYMLLKRVVERASGSSFAGAIRDHVAGPLGFAAMSVLEGIDGFGGLAPGYSRRFSATAELEDVRGAYDPGWCATGLVAATAGEVRDFYWALFGGNLVRRDSLAEMIDVLPVGEAFPPAVAPSYGLGLMADPDGPFGPEYGHGGAGPGFDLRAAVLPAFRDRRVCAVAICNTDEADSWAVLWGLLAALRDQLGETIRLC